MGGSHSARKITVENEDPAHVIRISDSLVERLRGQANQEKHQGKAKQLNNVQESMSGEAVVSINPPFYYPTLSSLEVRKESKLQLEETEKYWQQRIHELQEAHQKVDSKMEQEFQKTVAEVSVRFKKSPAALLENPCFNDRDALIKCYQENEKKPMLCASIVEAFTRCVDLQRAQVTANQ